jgi:pimeloyl-ACP methyl ester carboxylesterase
MGGLLGMFMAADAKSPIRRLVLNDVGALIPKAALERLATYVGADPRFAGLEELESYLRGINSGFGPLSDGEWRHLAEVSALRLPEDGGLALNYDPSIGAAFKAGSLEDIDVWAAWARVSSPTLVLRGAESDLLLRETAVAMAASRPSVRLVEIPACGHAPALMAADQIALVGDFLLKPL